MQIQEQLKKNKSEGKKAFAVLLDPDKISDPQKCVRLVNLCVENRVDYFFVGGSLITNDNLNSLIQVIKSYSDIPVVLFPGNPMQVDVSAYAFLFLSLISGRNPELLIGQHVLAAPFIRKSALEVLPTGYMLIESGKSTTVSYMSNTTPIPWDKPTVAACTAMAGEMLGLKLIYMDGGSGAKYPISEAMISTVRKAVDVPLIVGGGIRSGELAHKALQAGADALVVGNGIEKNLNLITEVSDVVHEFNRSLNIH